MTQLVVRVVTTVLWRAKWLNVIEYVLWVGSSSAFVEPDLTFPRSHPIVVTLIWTYPSICYFVSLLVSSFQVVRLKFCIVFSSPASHISRLRHRTSFDYPNYETSHYVCEFPDYHSGKVWGLHSCWKRRCIRGWSVSDVSIEGIAFISVG
jgi:hypothetical protein